MQALSNKYGMPIKIISISNFNDSNPNVERMEPDGDFIVKQKVEEMILLNTGRVHFDLIGKKEKSTKVSAPAPQDCPPAKVPSPGSLESPCGQVIKDSEQTISEQPKNEEIVNLKVELAESKKEIKALKELVMQLLPNEEAEELQTKTTKTSLEAHVTQKPNEEKNFECKTCSKI